MNYTNQNYHLYAWNYLKTYAYWFAICISPWALRLGFSWVFIFLMLLFWVLVVWHLTGPDHVCLRRVFPLHLQPLFSFSWELYILILTPYVFSLLLILPSCHINKAKSSRFLPALHLSILVFRSMICYELILMKRISVCLDFIVIFRYRCQLVLPLFVEKVIVPLLYFIVIFNFK